MAEPSPPSLGEIVESALVSIGRAAKVEVRQVVVGLMVAVAEAILALIIGLGLMVAGGLRLCDCLGHFFGAWLGNPILGDGLAGFLLIAAPVLWLWLLRRHRRLR